MSSAFEFLAMTAYTGYCGTPWRRWPWPPPPPDGDPWWVERFINNVYYLGLAGIVIATAITHPEEAFSLRYGTLQIVPAIGIVEGLYHNNARVPAATKAKM